jgi:hypothetical protein
MYYEPGVTPHGLACEPFKPFKPCLEGSLDKAKSATRS